MVPYVGQIRCDHTKFPILSFPRHVSFALLPFALCSLFSFTIIQNSKHTAPLKSSLSQPCHGMSWTPYKGSLESTEKRRHAVQVTIYGFYKACHRSLYEELAITSKLKRIARSTHTVGVDETISWAQFLYNLSHLLPFIFLQCYYKYKYEAWSWRCCRGRPSPTKTNI